uniref:WH2 domain-containing protein n=1 Tax=Macrostomum lignano TaxID=282301 RepID=A0A1I8FD60_9PLAT
ILREIREPRQVTSLAPTTLVLDRFGSESGSRLRRVSNDEVRASVHLSERLRPQPQPMSPLPPTPPLPDVEAEPSPPSPTPGSSSIASDTGNLDASASAALLPQLRAQLSSMVKTQQQSNLFSSSMKPRRNAKTELEPLSIGDVRQPAQQQQQPKRQRVRPPNRRRKSQESVWLQSRSLVNRKLAKDTDDGGSNDNDGSDAFGGRQVDSATNLSGADGANIVGGGGLLSLNSRSSTDRFKTNLAILSSKSYAALAGGQAGQRVGANQADSWMNREATSTGAVGRFNRQSTLVRLGGINRERSVMQTKRMDFPLKSQPQ